MVNVTRADKATQLLLDSTNGDAFAADALFPLVYDHLRSLAQSLFRYGRSSQTIDPTELVHEAYLKLVRHDAIGDLERTHFFRLAARAMRQVLCDHAAARRTAKRGGDWARVNLTIAEPAAPEHLVDAIEIHEALEALQQLDERKSEVVTLRFLAGMSIAETATALGVSVRTIELDWRFARMAPQETNERDKELARTTFLRVERLFHATGRMAPAEREEYLEREGVSDAERSELAALLVCDDMQDDAFDEARLSASIASKLATTAAADLTVTVGPGSVLGDFRLEAEVGRGGMAVVYRARQLSLDRTVALKVLCFPWMTDAVRQRFQREAAAGARLHHDNIVTVYHYGEHNDLLFFAMELVEGATLAQWLVQQRSQDAKSDGKRLSDPASERHAPGVPLGRRSGQRT